MGYIPWGSFQLNSYREERKKRSMSFGSRSENSP
jgi:hypothetical protein